MHTASQQRCKNPPPTGVLNKTLKNLIVMAPEILKFSGMRSTSSLPLLPGPLSTGVVAPDRVLSMGQIELFDIYTVSKQMIYAKLNC